MGYQSTDRKIEVRTSVVWKIEVEVFRFVACIYVTVKCQPWVNPIGIQGAENPLLKFLLILRGAAHFLFFCINLTLQSALALLPIFLHCIAKIISLTVTWLLRSFWMLAILYHNRTKLYCLHIKEYGLGCN